MRVVIAEDDALLREGLTMLLASEGITVEAAVDTADALLAAVARHAPEAVVVDVRLPPDFRDEGLRAATEARSRVPGLPVLVLSSYVEEAAAVELLQDGADGIGYLLKQRVGKVEEFIDALRRVAAGGTAIDPEVISQLLVRRRANDPLHRLTAREREVLGLMAEGLSNAEIAGRLFLSGGAINKYIRSIFLKLDLPPTETGNRRVLAVLTYLKA
ncbi:response regulator transcription factor [Nonomuraea mesophila]|uniref:Response regulator transcription factor n=1 Tax=Nonomuraea mesophila TaxID=2530382 RepID=A0A4R5EA77_9ACTN|nr:response regulator transcription factor [Nonomuraea mesophila]TDE29034.1 response regulator transcription factor [Nonomuraea mesophila]